MKLDKGQYYGTILQSVNINDLILTRSEYNAGQSLPTHYHQNAYLCFVSNGAYTECFSTKKLNCAKGDIVFHPGYHEHHNKFENTQTSCFNIEFTSDWLDKICFFEFGLNSIQSSREQTISHAFVKLFSEFNNPDVLSPLMIESLAIEILILFTRKQTKNNFIPNYIKKAVRLINENPGKNLSLSELSAILQISPAYLARSFKKAKGVTIGEFIRQYKASIACEMLRNKKNCILGVAIELGFMDQSHFTKFFKKELGITPGQYKVLYRS